MEKVFLKVEQTEIRVSESQVLAVGNLHPVKSGWVVKMNFGQNLEGAKGMAIAIQIAAETTNALAGWKDEDVELWDVVEIFDTEEEATKAGKYFEQMSIYQIETGKLKWLN